MVFSTIYEFINSTGNVADDFIGKRIIDVYAFDDCGLCLSIFNNVLITQKELGKDFFDYRKNAITMPIAMVQTDNLLKQNAIRKSIANTKPILSIGLTTKMLSMLPLELFVNLMAIWIGSKIGKYTLNPSIDKYIRIPMI